ncbi:rhamnolipids biosynthesis 3-oxoacyl-reductase [Sparassis crispa]|uniref:Rhamnolipids biosynthesis 3-oxoacyl-reductase n=1 Tax=Sparassis crispa TaxID=139825 RepID=A0A401H5Q6_9APHY|nr:rhamnolipids biosynthesis 3-oxoacyl-reductase [Sparassis crispa]GBE89778.1 rhamnolipids biosynthesis 3-oxoacyl-reductase [Sparassis crispa]
MSASIAEDLRIDRLYGVEGKVAVVTGGGSGIGTMIASAFVQNGAKVYIAARKEKQLQEVCSALNEKGPGSCHYFIADLTTKAGCDSLVAAIKERESKIHILVNNSGISWGAPYDSFPEKEGWDRLMALNVKSVFYMTVGLTDLLAKGSTNVDPGRVINVSSVASLIATSTETSLAAKGSGLWSYATSKAAVNHLTSQLAVTLLPKRITVNAILPGTFPSKMTAYGFKTKGDSLDSNNPMGRVGHPRDIAGIVLFLASPASAYITGAHITVDGGSVVSRQKAAL